MNQKPTISILFMFFLLTTTLAAQVLDFYPEKKDGITEDIYRFNLNILEETYHYIKGKEGNLVYANYWNLAFAYANLKQDKKIVREFLFKSKALDPMSFSIIFADEENEFDTWDGYLSIEEFNQLKKEADVLVASELNQTTSPQPQKKSLNNLVETFEWIKARDKQYRIGKNKDLDKQDQIDRENLRIIDSLYNEYCRYIGKSLVGEENQSVMWLVIQHSDIETMEKYLPILKKAVSDRELSETSLKMTIDRIYASKFNYQIFGSQIGVPLADEAIIIEVKKALPLGTY